MRRRYPSTKALDQAMNILLADVGIPSTSSQASTCGVSVDTLDAKISALRILRKHAPLYIDQHLTAATRDRNSLIPINKLPSELVVEILRIALATNMPWREYSLKRHQRLAQVQVLWWELIKSHPSFWTTIHGNEDPQHIALRLQKSRNAPLTIFCQSDWDNRAQTQGFMRQIYPHIDRWRVFHCQGDFLKLIKSFLEAKMPILEEMELKFKPKEGEQPFQPNLVGGPKLRKLDIVSINLPFQIHPHAFTSLKDLSISRIPASFISPSLCRALRLCPNLEELSLEEVSGHVGMVVPLEPIDLHHLSSFWFSQSSPDLAILLLRLLRPNPSSWLTLGTGDSGRSSEIFEQLLQSNGAMPCLLHSMVSTLCHDSLSLELSQGRLLITSDHIRDGKRKYLGISFPGEQWLTVLSRNSHLLPFSKPDFPFTINFHYNPEDGLSPDAYMGLVDLLPTVKSLTLACHGAPASYLLRRLARPKKSSGEWPWPKLSKLTFGSGMNRRSEAWKTMVADVAKVVKARQGQPGFPPLVVEYSV